MIRGSRAIQRVARGDSGQVLPEIPELATLYQSRFKVKFRRGQAVMIAGMPNDGKSAFALFIAERWDVPGIYFSADMEEHTAMVRLASMKSGDSAEQVEGSLRAGGALSYAEDLDSSKIHFCFDANPSLQTIEDEIAAFVEMYDEYPAWIVVDNLMDVVMEGESEYSAMKQLILELKSVARDTGACLIMLHHMSESGVGRDAPVSGFPPALKAVMGKVNQTAAMVLSVAKDDTEDIFRVAVVKHRNGPRDRSAKEYLEYRAELDRCRFHPMSMQRAAELVRETYA